MREGNTQVKNQQGPGTDWGEQAGDGAAAVGPLGGCGVGDSSTRD